MRQVFCVDKPVPHMFINNKPQGEAEDHTLQSGKIKVRRNITVKFGSDVCHETTCLSFRHLFDSSEIWVNYYFDIMQHLT